MRFQHITAITGEKRKRGSIPLTGLAVEVDFAVVAVFPLPSDAGAASLRGLPLSGFPVASAVGAASLRGLPLPRFAPLAVLGACILGAPFGGMIANESDNDWRK